MSGQNIDISVIVPVYQAKDYLPECVSSIRKAMSHFIDSGIGIHGNAQMVLIDDGSTDGSGDLCDSLKKEGDIVKHTSNCGVSHARNVGIEAAEGEYIAFVDSDDKVSESFLTDLYEISFKKQVAISDMMETLPDDTLLSGKDYIEKAVLYGDTHVWGKLFKKSVISDSGVRFREGLTIGEDMLFLMELAVKNSEKALSGKAVPNGYEYTDNEQGAMKKSFAPTYLDQIKCWKYAEALMMHSPVDFDNDSYDRLSEIQIMSAMLVAGKIACMDDESKAKNDPQFIRLALDNCSDTIKEAGELGRGFKRLSSGYKLKVMLFSISRNLYLKVYGKWKS